VLGKIQDIYLAAKATFQDVGCDLNGHIRPESVAYIYRFVKAEK
tara:strand:+ start:649 stop:780 length:132 start_codon:yes stop_codon:yes gene_type:complete